MFIEERHHAILEIIQSEGRVSIGDIQQRFGVSVDSARRDLRLMEERGLLKRTHGGAIPAQQVNVLPPRHREFTEETIRENYAAIAKRGAELVRENDVVYVNSGSTGFIALRYLPRNFPYTLVVNSASLANELKFWDNVTVYVVGGKMRMHSTASIVDSFATAFVKNMHFDLSLMTGAGYDAEFGLSNGTDETAAFQRAVIDNTRRNVLLLPGHKIGVRAFIKVCGAERFDTLITDWDAVEDELSKIEEKGVEVVVMKQ
jgi:DeoR/GlpR family transcriptional regulator of sugar metabolism